MSRDGAYLVAIADGEATVSVLSLAADGTPSHVTNSPFTQTAPNIRPGGLAATF